METVSAKETVLRFINALNGEDFDTAGNCLDEHMVFDGVMGRRDGGKAYIDDMRNMKFKYEIKMVFDDGNDVCVLYDINMGKATLFTCGWYHVNGGKILNLKVIFDPRPLLENK